MLVRHGVVGIGPYMRAYERQEFRSSWADPPAGTMTRWRRFLSDCTGTGFVDAEAPRDVLRMTFVNRPWGAGRSFINLHEILVWLNRDWLPQQQLARPVEVGRAGQGGPRGAGRSDQIRPTMQYLHAHALCMRPGCSALCWPNLRPCKKDMCYALSGIMNLEPEQTDVHSWCMLPPALQRCAATHVRNLVSAGGDGHRPRVAGPG